MSNRAKLNMVGAVVLAIALGAFLSLIYPVPDLRDDTSDVAADVDEQARASGVLNRALIEANREQLLDSQAALCAIGRLAQVVAVLPEDREALRVVERRLQKIDCDLIAKQIDSRGGTASGDTPDGPATGSSRRDGTPGTAGPDRTPPKGDGGGGKKPGKKPGGGGGGGGDAPPGGGGGGEVPGGGGGDDGDDGEGTGTTPTLPPATIAVCVKLEQRGLPLPPICVNAL